MRCSTCCVATRSSATAKPGRCMLAIFAVLGEESPLVREYRNKLASVLF